MVKVRLSNSIIVLSLFLLFTMVKAAENVSGEIRNIVPPQLDEEHLGRRILCHRPTRRGSPNMSIEQRGEKIIAHNYGHGGSGLTLAPGCASYVNNALEQSRYAATLNKNDSITIIGAGIIGLFTAYDLLQRGYNKITVIAEKFDDLASYNAGGLFAQSSMGNDLEAQKIIDEIGIYSYKFYETIAQGNHSVFKKGARIVPVYTCNREKSLLERYVGTVMQPAKDVVLDFGNGTRRKMIVYDDGIFIDAANMMAALIDYMRPCVQFVQRKITNFSEIEDKYIINCAGLGAKELNEDDAMTSIQGHLIMLRDQHIQDLSYMIGISCGSGITTHDQTVRRSFYIMPKKELNSGPNDVGVIGGTFIVGATAETPNEEEFDIVLKNAREFYGITA